MPSKHWKEAAMYAEDMARYDRPWELWEFRDTAGCDKEWKSHPFHPSWYTTHEYRRRPRTIRIGEYDVPEPMREAPEQGTIYYLTRLDAAITSSWDGHHIDLIRLNRGCCHLTREAAELHAKALLSFTRRDE